MKWSLNSVEKQTKSELSKNALVLIKNVFQTSLILEEVQIPVKKNKYLYLDYYLPTLKIAIEIDGKQHSQYSNFLSKNPLNFVRQKINDLLKEKWLTLNNITLIRLGYEDEPSIWREKLLQCGTYGQST